MLKHFAYLSLLACVLAPPVVASPDAPREVPVDASPAIDLGATSTVAGIIPRLADKRVVFIGELHTRYDHHLTQLEIIRGLHALNSNLAIGMEMFQQPFQRHLDDYIAGRIDEQALLRGSEYYSRWRMDYRHYAPILRFAREHGLPVVALNVASELSRKVARMGLGGLSEDERARLPADIAPADEAYRERIRRVFDYHPNDGERSFEHFLEAQLLWDEAMAERAATHLREHPDQAMVIIAGNQHVAWGTSMPERLKRRAELPQASILNSWDGPVAPGLADFLLLPEERTLPASGRIGALLEDDDSPVTIAECIEDGACATAGMKSGDRIVAIDAAPIDSNADLRLALWNKVPGDTISIDILRPRLLRKDKPMNYQLTLK